MENKKKKGNTLSIIILIIAIAVFLFAGWNIFKIWSEYHAGTEEYEKVAEYAQMPVQTEDTAEQQAAPEDVYPAVDMAGLLAVNPDTVGWIYFAQPEIINYPIVYCKDNTEYLHKTFEGNSNSSGTLFIDMNNALDFSDQNTIIYGHSMNNGAMFGDLDKFGDAEFGLANPVFYLYTVAGGVYRCRTFAFYETNDTSDSYTINCGSREEYQALLDKWRSQSMYDFGTAPSADLHVVTLSTCTNRTESGRYVLQAIVEKTLEQGNPPLPAIPWAGQEQIVQMQQ